MTYSELDVRWGGLRMAGVSAGAWVTFILPRHKRRRSARFYVTMEGSSHVVHTTFYSLKGVPKRVRDYLGVDGLEHLRKQCSDMFATHGLAEMKKCVAARDAAVINQRRKEARTGFVYAAKTALKAGLTLNEMENIIGELIAQQVMES